MERSKARWTQAKTRKFHGKHGRAGAGAGAGADVDDFDDGHVDDGDGVDDGDIL